MVANASPRLASIEKLAREVLNDPQGTTAIRHDLARALLAVMPVVRAAEVVSASNMTSIARPLSALDIAIDKMREEMSK